MSSSSSSDSAGMVVAVRIRPPSSPTPSHTHTHTHTATEPSCMQRVSDGVSGGQLLRVRTSASTDVSERVSGAVVEEASDEGVTFQFDHVFWPSEGVSECDSDEDSGSISQQVSE
jgi:hypothetical protein